MPFLPSEGEERKVIINNQTKDVLVFHYLPSLWLKEPIPNEVREFWYKERPDILKYFLTEYKHLDINFLPNSFLREALHKVFPNSLNSLLFLNSEFLINHFNSTAEVHWHATNIII